MDGDSPMFEDWEGPIPETLHMYRGIHYTKARGWLGLGFRDDWGLGIGVEGLGLRVLGLGMIEV